MESTRLHVLEALADGPTSGPAIAERLEISRAAVWKHIEALREEGVEISSTGTGYVLESIPEYGAAALSLDLPGTYAVHYADSMPSTNDEARRLATTGAPETIVITDEQPTGRGRLDRDWVGPSGGIYLSVLVRPDHPPMDVPILTIVAGVAVAEAIETVDLDPAIKWPNDVLLDERKVAGILTEMQGEADRVDWVIVGIGINANVERAALPAGATTLSSQRGESVNRRDLIHALVDRFDHYRGAPIDALAAWRDRAATLGRRVRVETPTETIVGEAVAIEHPGTLVVETDQGRHHVHAGDCEHLRPVD